MQENNPGILRIIVNAGKLSFCENSTHEVDNHDVENDVSKDKISETSLW